MKVKTLIEYLKTCSSDATVKIDAPYHNGYENSPVIDACIEPEMERVSDYGNEVIIEIANYQIDLRIL